jgi:hypothetical protein
LTLVAIYLSRVRVVGKFFAAALKVRTVAMPLAFAALNIGDGAHYLFAAQRCDWRALPLAEI